MCAVLVAVSAGCGPCRTVAAPDRLQYLGQAVLAKSAMFEDTVVGGLSGISYDPGRDLYYVISDDRSAHGPARFYTVALSVSDRGVGQATITAVQPLLDTAGRVFGPGDFEATPPVIPPDPEGIAFDARRQRLYWSSEGERRTHGPRGAVLADPWVRIARLDGAYVGQYVLPPQLVMSAQHTGPRRNTALEGLTLTPDGTMLFAAMEGPGYNDGPLPDREHGALTRVTAYRVDSEDVSATPVGQYAYPLEPATAPAQTNGLTDLVALTNSTFLVIERAFGDHPTVRLYAADLSGATDVLDMAELRAAPVTPMAKTLVADLADFPGLDPVDNIEGITLGPRLSDGRQTVVLVSDNNFSSRQVTQFLVFAMSPD